MTVRKINRNARTPDRCLPGRITPVVVAEHRVYGQIRIGAPQFDRIFVTVSAMDDRTGLLPFDRVIHLQIAPMRIGKNQNLDVLRPFPSQFYIQFYYTGKNVICKEISSFARTNRPFGA